MVLNNDNYFAPEFNMEFFGSSQIKSFLKCPAETMAELNGEYERPTSKALMMGSYIDAYFSDEDEEFANNHPEIFNSRTGELKADYRKADEIIHRAKSDKMFMEYLGGISQRIMTGELFGQPFKIKMDSYFPGNKIVDLKVMKNMDPIWKDGERKTFIDAWGYDIQGFIYQQVEKYNSGKELPFYIAAITKEEHPNMAVIHIPQWKLNSAGEIIKHYLPEIADMKAGNRPVWRCEKCGYCRDTKELINVMEYEELIEED